MKIIIKRWICQCPRTVSWNKWYENVPHKSVTTSDTCNNHSNALNYNHELEKAATNNSIYDNT